MPQNFTNVSCQFCGTVIAVFEDEQQIRCTCGAVYAVADRSTVSVSLKVVNEPEISVTRPSGPSPSHHGDPTRRWRWSLLVVVVLIGAGWFLIDQHQKATEERRQQLLLQTDKAALAGDLVAVKTMLKEGLSGEMINQYYSGMRTSPLHSAAGSGHPDVVRCLIDAGVQVNLKLSSGMTPLMAAASMGKTEAVATLLEKGADPNIKDTGDATALGYAALNGSADIVRLLIKYHANIQGASGGFTNSPLTAAIGNGKIEVVEILLESGAKVGLMDAKFAEQKGYKDIARLLRQHNPLLP
jgi:ankyrin repeat protein